MTTPTPKPRRKPGPKPRMQTPVHQHIILDSTTRDAAAVEATRRGLSLSEYLRMLVEDHHPAKRF